MKKLTPIIEDEMIICPKCGTEYVKSVDECYNCGSLFNPLPKSPLTKSTLSKTDEIKTEKIDSQKNNSKILYKILKWLLWILILFVGWWFTIGRHDYKQRQEIKESYKLYNNYLNEQKNKELERNKQIKDMIDGQKWLEASKARMDSLMKARDKRTKEFNVWLKERNLELE